MWTVEHLKKLKVKNPVLIEGLPGVGNVGKIAADVIVEETGADKIMSFSSFSLPNSVFVNENNLVELPSINLYAKKFRGVKKDLLILSGDTQPIEEQSCYNFSDKVLGIVQSFGCEEVVTLGGVGLKAVPKTPKIYCTGTNKRLIKKYLKFGSNMTQELYGVVGPIVGVSGVLLGLAARRKMRGVSLLAETYGHPFYIGIKGAQEILRVLNNRFDLKINISELNEEVNAIEQQQKPLKQTLTKSGALSRIKNKLLGETSYIG